MKRPCLGVIVNGQQIRCGALTNRTRCAIHERQHDRNRRPSPAERGYTTEYRKLRAELIDAEPWCHSLPCPYPDSGTPANPLTADHVTPLRAVGPNLGLSILCLRCNSAKGGRLGL